MSIIRSCSSPVTIAAIACTLAATAVHAQSAPPKYPLVATQILPVELLSETPRFSGYVSARETIRDDTATATIDRARLAMSVRPARNVVARIQADFASIGRTSGDTVPSFALGDAFVQLGPFDTTASGWRHRVRPAFIVGQFRTPFAQEYLTAFSLLAGVNRSQIVDVIAEKRDIGAMGHAAIGSRAIVSAALVNGEGGNKSSNPDGRQMLIGRVTILPSHTIALSAKWLREGADRQWGYDGRWLAHRILVEGEAITRNAPSDGTSAAHASGGYLLAAYTVSRWLQPVMKWEQLDRHSLGSGARTEGHLTWLTFGINIPAPESRLRCQIQWVDKTERPVPRTSELVVQLKAIF